MCFHYRVLDQEEAKETFTQWEETKRSQALVFLWVSMTSIAAAQWRDVENPRVMHWGNPWTKGTSRREWRDSPGAHSWAPGDPCRAWSDSGQTLLPIKESLRKCWNQEHWGSWQARRALWPCQLCQAGMVSRGRNPCPLSALHPPHPMQLHRAQREHSAIPVPAGRASRPIPGIEPGVTRRIWSFFVMGLSTWHQAHWNRYGTPGEERNLVQKWAGLIKRALIWIWKRKEIILVH